MYLEIFKAWIKQLDWKLLAQNCKVAFTVNNCSKHPHWPDLMAIDVIFLPPSTTSVTHSMRSLKAKYLAKVIRKHINTIDSNKELPKATDAMIMLQQPWSTLLDRTIINCIKKARSSMQGVQPMTMMIHLMIHIRWIESSWSRSSSTWPYRWNLHCQRSGIGNFHSVFTLWWRDAALVHHEEY